MSPRVPLAVALVVLLVSAGCLGASGGSGPTSATTTASDAGDEGGGTSPGSTTDATTTTEATTTSGVDCPDDREPYREVAVEHVATETGSDPANVSVVNDAFVDYPILGECYYNAKVRDAEAGETLGVYVAENETVVDREAVEARADRVYEQKYGKLSKDLYERVQSADAGEQISVEVSIADINRTAAKQAVDRENRSGAEYREALSEEYERRAEQKTQAVVADLTELEGVTVESVGSLYVQVQATPEGIEAIQRLDRVALVDLVRETTTYLG